MSPRLTQQIKNISTDNGLILLYHSITASLPQALQGTVHNVSAKVLKAHLQQLSQYFSFVSLKEFAEAGQKKGLAAITFDDGYKNVFENALPILEEFNCPFTVFLNPITLDGNWNWRDKVRYLIHNDLIDEFEHDYQFNYKQGRFYRYSKHPENNSAELDQALDRFLIDKEIDIYPDYPYLQAQELINHPLITYGNHTQNHYVLSSLKEQQQLNEIKTAHEALISTNLQPSNCFSAPFGGSNDINSYTYQCAKNLGYETILMSRQRLQPNQAKRKQLQILERFMPRSDNLLVELFQAQIKLDID